MRRKTTEEFIQQAIDVHGDKYDYNGVEYNTSRKRVTITCKEHGDWHVLPSSHLQGIGCPRCGGTGKYTTSEFIQKSLKVHNSRYSYEEVNYINSTTKVTITCPEHGDWRISPNNLITGKGCPRCVGMYKTTQEVVEKFKNVHGDKYDYSKTKYENSTTKVTITCPEHGDFIQKPSHHYQGKGCPKCGRVKLENSRLNNAKNRKFNGLIQPEEYKLIPLTKGKFAMVDNEDFDRLKDINWYFDGRYAKSNIVGYAHRYIMDAPDHLEVDHVIQENTLDNRRSNLRLATPAQNSANTRPKGGSSIYKGVSKGQDKDRWKGSIKSGDIVCNLGLFDDEIECAKAYDRKALELNKEFAYLNFPELKEQYLKELESLVTK